MEVGTAEFRNRLSYYLQEVRRGLRVVVTDRGRPVAQLVPFNSADAGDLRGRIAELVDEGLVTAEIDRRRTDFEPLTLRQSDVQVSRLVAQMRYEQ